MANSDSTKRASLGRTAQIGDVYDIRSERLLAGVNIFTENLSNDIINTEPNRDLSSEFTFSNKISDKLAALNIHGELSVSILAGLIKASGSLSYINEKVDTKEEVQCSFIQKIRTVDKKININDRKLKNLLARNIDFDGTHVVVGISYGANATVTMNYENLKKESKEKIEGELKILLEKLKCVSVQGSGGGTYDEKENELVNNISLKVHADMPPIGLEAPTNLETAMQFINSMAQRFAEANSEGKQLEFHLLSLDTVKKVFELENLCDRVLKSIEFDAIQRLEKLFDDINESSAMLQSLMNFVDAHHKIICEEDKKLIGNQNSKFEAAVAEMRHSLGDLLQKVRSGEVPAYKIEVLREMFEENSIASPAKIRPFVDSYKYLKEKFAFVKECQKEQITFVTEISELTNIKRSSKDKEVFLLFLSFNKDRIKSKWTENINFFFILKNNPGDSVFGVVDTDILTDMAKNEGLSEGIRVAQYFNGRYICADYFEYQEKLDQQCLAKCDTIYPSDKVNLKAVPIDFNCPKSLGYGKCSSEKREWACPNCRQTIEYNFDGNFYCDCGYNKAENFVFKCSDPLHGNDYAKFSKKYLQSLISSLKPIPEVNILVIGETGVGKSTWVNALANYITYKSLDDALKNGAIHLIPTEFELTKRRGNQVKQKCIKVGNSINENFTKGQSATQKTKAYVFRHNKILYRIFDTPGIGDSRGLQQDKTNMENIMTFLSRYKEIHGICILMKPNEDRLTPNFEFCFKELLVQFHRSAIGNIVFCFTNTSGYNFDVGQTLTPLKVLLGQIEKQRKITIPLTGDRLYPFDNMAYRYLCAVEKHNVKFSLDEEELYKRSYKISKDVTQTMLHYFSTRDAHNVEESISIYRARNVILRLTHPMALINTAVEETIAKLTDKQNLIKRFINDEKELRKILIKKIPLKRWRFDTHEETYCQFCATKEYYYGDQRLQFIEADPLVMNHNPFVLEVVKNMLQSKTDKCPECGDNTRSYTGKRWFYHEEGEREEEDITVAAQMKEKLKDRKGIQDEINKVQKLKTELMEENDRIVKASAKFAHFLSTYSITTYNDATEKYLKLLIEREEKTGTQSKKALYENLLSQYDSEKLILEQQLNQLSSFGNHTLNTSDIMETIENLKKLKHYGKDIADAIEGGNKMAIYEASAEESEIYLPAKSYFNIAINWVKKHILP